MADTKITSQYDMLNEYAQIAANYFGPDLSTQRIGMFGFTAEALSRNFNYLLLESMFRSREFHTVTAERMETLLLDAATLKIDVSNAVPATMDTFIGIPVNDILGKGTSISPDYEFILDKDTVINILGIDFMMEYDMYIYAKKINNDYSFSTKFMTNDQFAITNLKNPYVMNYRSVQNGIDLLMVRTPLRQMTKNYSYHTVLQNDEINLTGIEFSYSGKLAYFNIYYKEASSQTYQYIQKQNILSKATPTGNYLLYDTTEDGIIKITADAFKPKFNSEIRVDIYTTKGFDGNFEYKGNNRDINVNLKSFNDLRDYVGMHVACVPISQSAGGKNAKTLEQLRTEIIDMKSSLGGLDTEIDLERYFARYDTTNNITFIKKRSDVIERRFTSYMIPRNENGDIIPTVTMNMKLSDTDFDAIYPQTGRKILKANSKFSLAPNATLPDNEYVLQKNKDDISTYSASEDDKTKLLLGTPYLMVVDDISVSFYNNSINAKYGVTPEFINSEVTTQFVVNFVNIQRNAVLGEQEYTITANIMANGDISDVIDSSGNIINPNAMMVKGFIYDNGEIPSYFDFSLQYDSLNKYFTATAKLKTDDYLSPSNQLQIIDSLYLKGEAIKAAGGVVVAGNNLKMGIAIYHDIPDNKGQDKYATILPNTFSNYTLVNVYTNTNELANLYADMTNVVRATLSHLDGGIYNLSEVPLIQYSHLMANTSRISSIISNSKQVLDDINKLVTNNFSLDYKFFRTYGRSQYFSVGQGASTQPLDRLDLRMKFRVYLNPGLQIVDSEITTMLRNFIKKYIESLNSNSNDYTIYISNITTAVENSFRTYVKAIDLLELNDFGDELRVIKYSKPVFELMSSEKLRDYVPEYINIPLNKIEIVLVK